MKALFILLLTLLFTGPLLQAQEKGKRSIVSILDGDIVTFDGQALVPLDAASLRPTRLFLFFYGGGQSGASRRLTPQLVSIRRELIEKQVPVEIIYMGADDSPATLEQFMRESGMTFPAVRFGRVGEASEAIGYIPEEIPTLVLYDAGGRKLSDTYQDGEFVGPAKVLQDLYRLTGLDTAADDSAANPPSSAPTWAPSQENRERGPGTQSPSGTNFDSFFD